MGRSGTVKASFAMAGNPVRGASAGIVSNGPSGGEAIAAWPAWELLVHAGTVIAQRPIVPIPICLMKARRLR
jgi:hypothetical protein